MSSVISDRKVGHWFLESGAVLFRVWAPKRKKVELELRSQSGGQEQSLFHEMQRDDQGYFEIEVEGVAAGDQYCYRLDGEVSRPDPAARFFSGDVHRWGVVVDHRSYQWKTDSWTGVAKSDLVIYELHIGTFTDEGTFLAAINRLDELVSLGVTAIEILPLAECPGRWNWGYDGVGIFAVQNAYGTIEQFKQFVDACHQRSLAVILDVVYNHLGPEGNYLSEYGPYFTKKRKTPWGDAINFDGVAAESSHVRGFMIQNALYWLAEFRLDGLRVDAVHFMFDDSDEPISISIARGVDELREQVDYPLHFIGETNVHNAALEKLTSPHGTGFDAVWSDCLMHSLLGIGQPGLDLCKRDHHGAVDAARALDQGFLYESFPYQRHDLGVRADLDSFVIGLQNHDTVGNHPMGLRLAELASRDFQMAAAALYLLYPAIPMLFMGEEFACENPFLFFADFKDPWVRDGVEKGRAAEFAELMKQNGLSPLAPESFEKSRIGSLGNGDAEMWQWYQSLIASRKVYRDQKCQLLSQENLKVVAEPERGYFRLEYARESQQASGETDSLTVAVCLAEKSKQQDPIDVVADGEIILSSQRDKSSRLLEVNQAIVFANLRK